MKYHAVRFKPTGKAHVIDNWPTGRGYTLCGREYDPGQTNELAVEADPKTVCGVCLNVVAANRAWGVATRAFVEAA